MCQTLCPHFQELKTKNPYTEVWPPFKFKFLEEGGFCENLRRSPCDPVIGSRVQGTNLSGSLLSGGVRAIEAKGTDLSSHEETLTFCLPVWPLWIYEPQTSV